uniref:Uncharacterized protein n=1 Tax=Anguilla anguilla TaxID=7936 RepID=A0A0E9XI56_ANGAN
MFFFAVTTSLALTLVCINTQNASFLLHCVTLPFVQLYKVFYD